MGLLSKRTMDSYLSTHKAPPVTSRNAREVLEAGHCEQTENSDDKLGTK